jgi:hypothetical protein
MRPLIRRQLLHAVLTVPRHVRVTQRRDIVEHAAFDDAVYRPCRVLTPTAVADRQPAGPRSRATVTAPHTIYFCFS